MAFSEAALGIKPHTGWAAYVVLGGEPGALRIFSRGRVELLPKDGSIPCHVYHDAANLSEAAANVLVTRAKQAATSLIEAWLERLISEVELQRAQLQSCAVIVSNTGARELGLSAILQSHPLIHAAEGKLFQDVCVEACASRNIPTLRIPEREVWNAASNTTRRSADALRKEIDGLRKTVGAPWASDQKVSTAAAAAALGAYDHRITQRQGPLPARGKIRSVR